MTSKETIENQRLIIARLREGLEIHIAHGIEMQRQRDKNQEIIHRFRTGDPEPVPWNFNLE